MQAHLQRLDGLGIHTLELVSGHWSLRGASLHRLIVRSASVAGSRAAFVDCSHGSDPWVWRKLIASGAEAGCVTFAAIEDTVPDKLGSFTSLCVHIPQQRRCLIDETDHMLADLRLLCQRLGADKAGHTCKGRFGVLQVLLGSGAMLTSRSVPVS